MKPGDLLEDDIEAIEKASMRALWIAARDFAEDARDFFAQSLDDPKDIAEDITREMLDRLGGYGIPQRIFGNVDYRKARYAVLPDFDVRQALFVDSKAEKQSSSATLQMSQLSMSVRQLRDGTVDTPGLIAPIQTYGGLDYLSTTLLAHYHYDGQAGNDGMDRPPYRVRRITLTAIPNGRLQARYNPDAEDTIWIAGRNAPSRGESFRVRLSFHRLRLKAPWRVQTIDYDTRGKPIIQWSEA